MIARVCAHMHPLHRIGIVAWLDGRQIMATMRVYIFYLFHLDHLALVNTHCGPSYSYLAYNTQKKHILPSHSLINKINQYHRNRLDTRRCDWIWIRKKIINEQFFFKTLLSVQVNARNSRAVQVKWCLKTILKLFDTIYIFLHRHDS